MHGLVDRADRAARVGHGVGGGLAVDAHRVGDLLHADGATESGGQGLLRREGLADPLPGAAGGPVGGAHVVGEGTGDPGAGVRAEGHAEIRVERLGGGDECEGPDGSQVVAVEVGGARTDVRHDVADERQVFHDHRVACVPVHWLPLVDVLTDPSVGATDTGPREAGAVDEEPPGSLRAAHPRPCDAVPGRTPAVRSECIGWEVPGAGCERPQCGGTRGSDGPHFGGHTGRNGRSCPPVWVTTRPPTTRPGGAARDHGTASARLVVASTAVVRLRPAQRRR